MSKEFIWAATVDEEKRTIKCVVDDSKCMIYEDEMLIQTLEKHGEAKANVLQIDRDIQIWGKTCRFQLENNVPYIRMDGKWTSSDTTMAERQVNYYRNQKVTSLVQCGLGIAVCAGCGIRYLVTTSMGNWWFALILGSVMGIGGLVQWYTVRKEMKENEKKVDG